MVIILSNSRNPVNFKTPRQLFPIQGEPLVKRTIRLLKENRIEDIFITSCDKRFDNLGATRYEPKYNDYIPDEQGYWLDAFPLEILKEPTIYLFGDVYYSENAIKTILETPTNDVLFFCTHNNQDERYIKTYDEPLAYKVTNIDKFKKHINIVKKAKDEVLCCREPITWELYRSMHGIDINTHEMTTDYVAINDESCDIDTRYDIIRLETKLGGNVMVKVKAIEEFTLGENTKYKFEDLKDIKRAYKTQEGKIYKGDTFTCNNDMADYLTGNNDKNVTVVEIIEVIPEEEPKYEEDPMAGKVKIEPVKPKKTTKKKSKKK